MSGDSLLRRLPAALASRVERAGGETLRGVDASVLAPLREALDAAATAHAKVAGEAGLAGAAGIGRQEARETVAACRLAAHEDVLEPLVARMRALAAGEAVESAFEDLLGRLAAMDRDIPARIVAREAPGVFEPERDDGPLRAARKAATRARRRLVSAVRAARGRLLRLAGRQPDPAPERRRMVPVGTLLDFHLRARLPAGIAPARTAARQAAARPIARLEASIRAWRSALLEAETALESADDRIPPELRPEPAAGEDAEREEAEGDGTGRSTGDAAGPAASGLAGELLAPEEEPAGAPGAGGDGTGDDGAGATADAGPGPADVLARVREAADAFAAAIAAARDDAGIEPARHALQEAVTRAAEQFRRDLDRAGTWLLRDRARAARAAARERAQLASAAGHGAGDPERIAAAWQAWHREARDRLTLEVIALRNWKAIEEIQADHAASVAGRAVSPLLSAARAAGMALREAVARLDAEDRPGTERLEAERAAIRRSLREGLLDRLEAAPPAGIVRAESGRVADRMYEANRALPEWLELHALPDPDRPVDPFAPARTFRLRESVEQARDVFLVERLRAAGEPLAEALEEAVEAARDAGDAVEYGFDAAGREGEDPATARELVRHALSGGAEALAKLESPLREALAEFVRAGGGPYGRARALLLERMVPDAAGVQDQIAGMGTRLRTRLEDLRARLSRRLGRGRERVASWARSARERVRRWLRLGAHAVGAGGGEEDDVGIENALEAVAGVGRLLARAPLIYQRLFTLRPLPGPDLLVGREEEMETARRHLERWRDGLADALVIVAPHAGGKTSFLNAVEKTLLDGEEAVRVVLQERIESERELAVRISAALELSPPATDLEELSAAILEGRAGGPRTVFVENLEQLLLRVVGGAMLIERMLTFLSRTDVRIRWFVTVTEHGWEYVDLALESVGSLPRVLLLHPLERDEMEEALLTRHRRSGLGVTFEAPEGRSPLLYRRLRRAGSEKERQEVLRSDWFDRLHRAAGPHPILAIFYWLRSAAFDAQAEVLRIRPLRPLDFGYIQRLDRQQAFVLKAMLQHTTLSLAEAERIFGFESQEAFKTFESLGNLLLIEEADAAREADRIVFARISREGRYRVRPLLVHPVTTSLRARHILH